MTAWHDVPEPPAHRRRLPPQAAVAGRALAAVVVGVLGPFVRTLLIAPAPAPVVVAVVGLAALVLIARAPRGRWPAGLAAAAVAGVVAIPFGGLSVGLWLAGGLVLAGWVALDRAPLPMLGPVRTEALGPAVALAAVATWRGADLDATVAPLLLVAASGVTTLAISRFPEGAARVVAAVRTGARRGAAAVLLTPLWLVAVVAPWAVHRVLRIDPLRAPVGPEGIVRRERSRTQPGHLWASERAVDRLPGGERFRRRLVLPVVALLALGALVWSALPRPGYDDTVPAAMADSPWWSEYRDTVRWYETDVFDPLRFRRQPDVISSYFNVRNEMRVTWRAPACSCRRVRLWLYGGSTVFGFGQRDEHTIASELARLARSGDGITLDVENRGVSGDTHWVEATRFAWDATVEAHPDLVVFYDGVNDLGAAQGANGEGRADDPLPIDSTLEDLRDGIAVGRRWFSRFDGISAPDGVVAPARDGGPVLEAADVGRAAARRYERTRQLSRLVGEDAGIPVAWFWQPSVATRPPVDGEPGTDAATRARAAAAASALDPDVVDLSDALDRAGETLFYDEVHTNERGARLVAEAIYAEVRDQLRAAAGDGAGPGEGS